ncbi:hypothetical protein [Roseateles noduli]|uniref:hypothetical protein n=1 Tax=Roseateles noduli TaxID=2052484 RepID=UPI003D649FB7
MSTTKYARAIRVERNSGFKTAILLSSLAIGAGLLFSAVEEARGAAPVTNTFPATATIMSARMVSEARPAFGSAIPSQPGHGQTPSLASVVPGSDTDTDTAP